MALKYRLRISLENLMIIAAAIWIFTLLLLLQDDLERKTNNNIWKDIAIKFKFTKDLPAYNGAGEMGKPVILPKNLSDEINKTVSEGWNKNKFNQYVSDMISLNRTLPDVRRNWCKEPGRYLKDLPITDVIICFNNEAWSTLLRTVHSVINRSPEHLIGRIILVDDYSNMTHLKKPLDDYFASYPMVKIVRATKREGLIRARLLGLKHSTSPVLTFLDSHCECTEGWLEPLLDRIARNSTTVVTPFIDIINFNTFEYLTPDENLPYFIGGFNWRLEYDWIPISDREMKRHTNPVEPMHTPTIAGGLFSIDRKFFEHLGTYDAGFDYWGSENLELSFKTWMCGGTLEMVFCSHVGHIYREETPIYWPSRNAVVANNSIRLANVWLDDYAEILYKYFGKNANTINVSDDIRERKQLRERLGCKSFQWYLDNVFPEKFIPTSYGSIVNIETNMCLDAEGSLEELGEVGIAECHGKGEKQFWMITKLMEIRKNYNCLMNEAAKFVLKSCNHYRGNKHWKFNPITQQIENSSTNLCLSICIKRDKAILEKCNSRCWRQRWRLE